MPDAEFKWLHDIQPGAIAFVKRASVRDSSNPTEPQRFLFWKAEDPEGGKSVSTASELLTKKVDDLTDEDKASLRKMLFTKEEIAKLEAPAPPAPTTGSETVHGFAKAEWDAMPPAMRTYIEKAEREKADERQKREAAEQAAAGERVRIRKAELKRDLETSLSHLPMGVAFEKAEERTPDAFADLMHDVETRLGSELAGRFTRVLKSASAAIKQGALVTSRGTPGSVGSGNSGDTWARIQAGAKTFMKSEEGKDLTEAQAIDHFLKTEEGSKLYEQYSDERRGLPGVAAASNGA